MLKYLFGSNRASKVKFRVARNILATFSPREIIAMRDPKLNDLLLRSLNGEQIDLRSHLTRR